MSHPFGIMWNSSTWLYSHKINLSHAASCLLFSFVRPAYFLAFIGTIAPISLSVTLYWLHQVFSVSLWFYASMLFIQSGVCIIVYFSISEKLTDCLINQSRQSLISMLCVQFQVYWLVFTVGQIYLIVYLLLWHRFSIQNTQFKIFHFRNCGWGWL